MSVDIDAHYKNAKAILWSEDPETRAWLDAVWQGLTPTIKVLVAGGHANVNAVCKQALDAGWTHVFGLTDQDFGTSNRARWNALNLAERVYRLDVHETENLLLDAAALAGCILNTGKRSPADIERKLLAVAQSRAWWVACIRFLANTNLEATNGYPANPGTIASLADAEAYVNNSVWFSSTAAGCPALAVHTAVSAGLQAAHGDAMAALADGSWRIAFPGKQLFREICGYVQQNAKGASSRIDLVKAVVAWQRANGVVPSQAQELRDAILKRI